MRLIVTIAVSLTVAGCSQSSEGTDASGTVNSDTSTLKAPALPDIKPGQNTLFVNVERVQRRTCPDIACGDVGGIAERQLVEALERRDGWVRITKLYDASCKNGVSEYVDAGKATCTTDNGIVLGKFAEWVPMSALSAERPADSAQTATGDEAMIAQSDDFKRYRTVFTEVAQRLVTDGRCTKAEFVEQGGWVKSVTQYKAAPVYFTYCGGMTSANKIYMNAETGQIL